MVDSVRCLFGTLIACKNNEFRELTAGAFNNTTMSALIAQELLTLDASLRTNPRVWPHGVPARAYAIIDLTLF